MADAGAVTVVGAGVAGLATAAELVARGARVTLIERAEGVGPHGCSWWAGGMLAPFCERESAEPPVETLGRRAAQWWRARGAAVTEAGTLVVALGRDQGELRRFARRTDGHEEIGEAEIAALEPDLAGRFRRGLFFAGEAHLDPRKSLARLVEGLRAAGVELRFGEDADELAGELAGGLAGPVVDCRGFAAAGALPKLRGVKGEMAVIRSREVTLARPVRLLHPRHPLYVVPRGDGVFMLGATTVESADRGRVTARGLMELLGAAYALHPAFGEAEVVEIGVDVRPAFPDNLPRVTRRGSRVYLNGLYRHGFLLGPAMAAEAAEAALRPDYRSEWIHDDHPER